ATSFILTKLSEFIFSIPELIVSFFIMLFVFFFALRDGETIISKAKQLIPLEEHYKKRFEKKITSSIESLFYGTMVLAAIETIVAIIGFYFLGISAPILWGFVVGLTAVLPGIGATVIWIPMAIIAYFQGNTINAIIIALFGFLILSTLIDTFLRAKILGMRTETHPLIIIVGVLGGISAFGFIGLFIGPLILSLFELILEIYTEKKNEA
ncbi:AI-2E family transporter, partial [Candidatus Woesearchaeota archaeon]|nr:AI-2E family transporter [Candidatus Woesearchaeota archaeon]